MKRILSALAALFVALSALAAEKSDTISGHIHHHLASAGSALIVNAASTELFKHTIHELRPDRTSNRSFPSRHTSWAFTAATILSNTLYTNSPWWSVAAHAAASSVGQQRIIARRHWGSDVIAGATTGIISTELAYFICRKIFRQTSPWATSPQCIFHPSLGVSSEAIYWLNSPSGKTLCAGFGTALRFRLPLSDCWGFDTSARIISMPVKISDSYSDPLSAISLTLGAAGHFVLSDDRLAFVCNAAVGPCRWIGDNNVRPTRYSFNLELGSGFEWYITNRFGFRAQANYNIAASSTALHAIALSVSSLVVF